MESERFICAGSGILIFRGLIDLAWQLIWKNMILYLLSSERFSGQCYCQAEIWKLKALNLPLISTPREVNNVISTPAEVLVELHQKHECPGMSSLYQDFDGNINKAVKRQMFQHQLQPLNLFILCRGCNHKKLQSLFKPYCTDCKQEHP